MATRFLAATVAACVVAPSIASADSMRCGSKVISEGDSIDEVLAYCGEPVDRQRTWIQRQPRFQYGGREISFPGQEDVPVDVWTFDFGASKLMRRVRFVAGTVDRIDTLEHGSSR